MAVRKLKIALAESVQPEYTSCDGAELLSGVSKWTWRSYAHAGKIESCKVGTRLLIPLSEIRRVIREGTRARSDGKAAGEPSHKTTQCFPATTKTDEVETVHA